MLKKRSKNRIYVSTIIVSLFLVLVLFEVKVGHSIRTYFEVQPLQKWVLAKGAEGQIISSVTNFKSGASNNISVVQFERGEIMNFNFIPSIESKVSLMIGDSVGIVYSSRLHERLTQLKGVIQIAQADLAAKSTGEKQALIEESRKKIKYSEAKIQEKNLLFDRTKELYSKEYISKEAYDASLWELKQAEIENEIDKAQLQVYLTGSKNEDLKVLKTTINSYLSEIELLNKRLQDFVLRSPISGEILRDYSKDTLLVVNNTSKLILHTPVRFEDAQYLREGNGAQIELKNISGEVTGVILSVSKEVKILNGVQILYARILIDPQNLNLVPGLLIGGEIILPKVTITEYLISLLEN
jgi:HlyD family secretion protein